MTCPKCRSAVRIKNGHVRGLQRYKCKDCGCNYTHSSMSRTPIDKRIKCIRLYLEGVGFRGIARLTGISHVTVMRWVKALADRIDADMAWQDKRVAIMELDEMWHFVGKKKPSAGSGLPGTEMDSVSAAFSLGKEIRKPRKVCGSSLKCSIWSMFVPTIIRPIDRLFPNTCMLKQNLKPPQLKD